ncbi:PAS domain S-box protein [Aequorivita sp. F47161]|uniref:histidine kinase n=1 Tax=Aequorivita vitellina TaxID=2874475 RepID=A0A9X1QT18_9FLAO|nr:PAS domain-containing sensor histidine kinase [Aequorivita vitellina]MCG2418901.1 PAS domain S-box protein [Aequorivita vitellina]
MKIYSHIIDDLDLGVWEFNVETQHINCNENWAAILGYTVSELQPITTDTWNNLFHPKYIGKSKDLFKAHLEGKTEQYKCEIRLKHKKGHYIWIYAQGRVVTRKQNGKPVLVVGTNRDISEEKKDQLKLKRYKDISEIASEVAQTGYWEIDYLTNSFYWSPKSKEIYGESKDFEPKEKEVLNYFPEGENRERVKQAVKDAVLNKKNFDLEVQVNSRDKSLKWVRMIGIAEFRKSKCIRLYGIVQDIDAFKKIQIKTIIQEEQFRQTFVHAPIGMALVDLDGTWLKVNEEICHFLGFSKKELYALTFKDITHPHDLEKDIELLTELLNDDLKNYQMDKRYIRKNGDVVWANLSVSLVRDDDGNPLHFVSQIQDINENKKLTEAIQDQNKRLINFAYIVSHNLRSHTGNIAMLLDLMIPEMEDSSENEYIEHLKTASNNLTETVKHLNEVVVINTKIYDNLVPLNLYRYVSNALGSIQGLVTATHTAVIINIEKEIYIAGIPAYLESILLNFLTNAIKYKTPKGTPRVELSANSEDDNILLKIKDNGVGINLKRDGKRLFGMYQTFHNNEDSRGIGLFITKNQIEAMGGKIEVESVVGKGTQFTIYFKKWKTQNTILNQ